MNVFFLEASNPLINKVFTANITRFLIYFRCIIISTNVWQKFEKTVSLPRDYQQLYCLF